MTSSPSSGTGPFSASSADGLTLAELASLDNYAFHSEFVGNGTVLEVTGRVHSPTDWQAVVVSVPSDPSGETLYDVDGTGYAVVNGQVSPLRFRSPEGEAHLRGEEYFAELLLTDLASKGMRLTRFRDCEDDGISGRNYELGASTSGSPNSVCLADSSGALLVYFLGNQSGAASQGGTAPGGTVTSFVVSSVGTVGPIGAP